MKFLYKEFSDDQKQFCRRFGYQHGYMKSLRIRKNLELGCFVASFNNEKITNV